MIAAVTVIAELVDTAALDWAGQAIAAAPERALLASPPSFT